MHFLKERCFYDIHNVTIPIVTRKSTRTVDLISMCSSRLSLNLCFVIHKWGDGYLAYLCKISLKFAMHL